MSRDLFGWIASAVFLVRLMPQPVRLARTGVGDGVSPVAAINAVVSAVGWILYGLSVALAPVWAVAAAALPVCVWTVVLLRKRILAGQVAYAAIWFAVVVVAWRVGGLALVLGASVIVNHGPQVWTAIRSNDLGGIAGGTWRIAIVDASLWGGYGVVTGDPALMGYGVILTLFSVVVLARVRQVAGRTEDEAAPELEGGLSMVGAGGV